MVYLFPDECLPLCAVTRIPYPPKKIIWNWLSSIRSTSLFPCNSHATTWDPLVNCLYTCSNILSAWTIYPVPPPVYNSSGKIKYWFSHITLNYLGKNAFFWNYGFQYSAVGFIQIYYVPCCTVWKYCGHCTLVFQYSLCITLLTI